MADETLIPHDILAAMVTAIVLWVFSRDWGLGSRKDVPKEAAAALDARCAASVRTTRGLQGRAAAAAEAAAKDDTVQGRVAAAAEATAKDDTGTAGSSDKSILADCLAELGKIDDLLAELGAGRKGGSSSSSSSGSSGDGSEWVDRLSDCHDWLGACGQAPCLFAQLTSLPFAQQALSLLSLFSLLISLFSPRFSLLSCPLV